MSDRVSTAVTTPRAQLVRAARELFAERAYDAVHVDDLLKQAGVSRATFYRLFASKQHCYEEACSEKRPPSRDALTRLREGAREAFGQYGYEAVRVEHMLAASGVARSTFYRFFRDKHDVFVELDRTAFQFLRWEIGVSSVHPELRRGHLRFTVESFVEWRTQVGRSSLEAGEVPPPPRLPMVAFHTLLDEADPDAPRVTLDSRLPEPVVDAAMVAVDTLARQAFDGDVQTQNATRVRHALSLLEPLVRSPSPAP